VVTSVMSPIVITLRSFFEDAAVFFVASLAGFFVASLAVFFVAILSSHPVPIARARTIADGRVSYPRTSRAKTTI
jgi:hypothetical protein